MQRIARDWSHINILREAGKILMWSSMVAEEPHVSRSAVPFVQIIGQMAELVELASVRLVRGDIRFLNNYVNDRRDLLRFLDGQNVHSFTQLWNYFREANGQAVASAAAALNLSERQLDDILPQLFTLSKKAVVDTFMAVEELEGRGPVRRTPTASVAPVAQDKRKKNNSTTTLRKWTRAAKEHGYLRSGEQFKRLPRKGTKAHRAIYKTFQAMK